MGSSFSRFLVSLYLSTFRIWNTNREARRTEALLANDLSMWTAVNDQIKMYREAVKTEADILDILKIFKWTPDPLGGAYDYSPTLSEICVSVVLKNKFTDDCDGAARFTHYLYRLLDEVTGKQTICQEVVIMPTPLISGFTKSHVIFVKKDEHRDVIYSNGGLEPFISLKDYCDNYIKECKMESYITLPIPTADFDDYLKSRATSFAL